MTRIEPLPIALLLALSAAPTVPRGLVALAPISNEALKGSELPTRLKLLNWGDNETTSKGVVKVGKKTLAALAANQARFGFDTVALDYNHNSLPGHPNFQKDPRKVGGYGKPVVIEGDGLYLEGLSYTPSGREHAAEYSDLSPTPLLDETGEVVFLHSTALCPQGEVKGLTFLSASFLKPLSAKHTAVVAQRTTMDYKSLLCTLLGLDGQTATDDDIQTAAEARAKKEDADTATADPTKEGAGKEQAPDDKTALATTITKAITDALKPLTTQFATQARDADAEARKAIDAEALAKGKLIPLSARKLPLDVYRQLVSELPEGTVPVDQRTPENVTALAAGGAPDAGSAQVMSLLGIGKDDWEKFKPKS